MRRLWVSPWLTQSNEQDLAEHARIMRDIQRDRALPPRRPASPPPRRVSVPAAAARPPGYRSGEPSRVCLACHEPAHLVAATLMCERCAAEVRWRVGLLRQGLKVVW